MTKLFRVQAEMEHLIKCLHSPNGWPVNFYELLKEHDIDPMQSALLGTIPEQGCLCVKIIDQHRRLIEFDLEYDGVPWDAEPEATAKITELIISELDADDSWWREHPRMTAPKPNNPICVALQLLGEGWKPKGRRITR